MYITPYVCLYHNYTSTIMLARHVWPLNMQKFIQVREPDEKQKFTLNILFIICLHQIPNRGFTRTPTPMPSQSIELYAYLQYWGPKIEWNVKLIALDVITPGSELNKRPLALAAVRKNYENNSKDFFLKASIVLG